jgi:glutamyl/glutaminyl-tRNA synthetase
MKTLPGYTHEKLKHIAPLLVERIAHFNEITTMADAGELSYYFEAPHFNKEKLFWKEERDTAQLTARLRHATTLLEQIDAAQFTQENIKKALWDYAEQEGRGSVLWPLRYALSGREKSPDPFQLASILGKEETFRRLTNAITLCTE